MALEPISAGLDPLLWARKPRSQHAFYRLKAGADGGNTSLSGILGDLVEAGVCTGDGKLLYCWQGGQWVSVDPPRPAA